jgi:hypothetical protein
MSAATIAASFAAHGPVELPRVAAADRKGPGPPRPLRVKRVGFAMSAICPVYPDEQTSSGWGGRSQTGQEETHAPQQRASLFYHLVGAREQYRWHP